MRLPSQQFRRDMEKVSYMGIEGISEEGGMVVLEIGSAGTGTFKAGIEKAQLDGKLGITWPRDFPERICLRGAEPAEKPSHMTVSAAEENYPAENWVRYTLDLDENLRLDAPDGKTLFMVICFMVGIE